MLCFPCTISMAGSTHLQTHLACLQVVCAPQCEEQCLLDMLQKADAAVACVRSDALEADTAPDAASRAGGPGAAPATGSNAINGQHSDGLASSACEGAERAGAVPASAAVAPLPEADGPVQRAADAGTSAECEHRSSPTARVGLRAGRARAVPFAGAALPGTHDGPAADCSGALDFREREGEESPA